MIMKRLEKEKKTIAIMIRIFCGTNHGTDSRLLCPACNELLDYAEERLSKCPYGENKGACSKCKIHCYKPDMRKHITDVMRFSGPKMVTKHPLLAIDHLIRNKTSRRLKTKSGKHNNI
ncbi:MAG: nitrous oxide-stimulated promoter family protein [Planctomycetota bacterium]|jgi:hypothetical protein